jgi:hypothetical protein
VITKGLKKDNNMKIEKEQLKSLTLNENKLTIEYTGKYDRTAISKLTLIVNVEENTLGESSHYL